MIANQPTSRPRRSRAGLLPLPLLALFWALPGGADFGPTGLHDEAQIRLFNASGDALVACEYQGEPGHLDLIFRLDLLTRLENFDGTDWGIAESRVLSIQYEIFSRSFRSLESIDYEDFDGNEGPRYHFPRITIERDGPRLGRYSRTQLSLQLWRRDDGSDPMLRGSDDQNRECLIALHRLVSAKLEAPPELLKSIFPRVRDFRH